MNDDSVHRIERRLRYMLAEHRDAATALTRTRARAAGSRLAPGRIAILGTPRCANTYLRMLLAKASGLEQIAVHHPADIEWSRLPERVAIQLHWPRTDYLKSLLDSAGVSVVTVSRHPFDVLVSVLRFAQTEPDTIEWLWGEGGDEEELPGADPSSEAFGRWATGPRAEALLAVTDSWLEDPTTTHVRYQELVESPVLVAERVLDTLSLPQVAPLGEAVENLAPRRVNEMYGLEHAWQAASGLWQELLPADLVNRLLPLHRERLKRLGFDPEPRGTDHDAALARWRELFKGGDADWPDSAYRAAVTVLDPPSTLEAGSRFTSLVKVHNQGMLRWPDRGRHPLIRLGCRWTSLAVDDRDSGGKSVVLEDRCLLEKSLLPGSALYQMVTFDVPPVAGTYLLEIDLIHEGVRWFGSASRVEVEVS